MVSDPKHLSDLWKIAVGVRITCLWCAFEDDWTPDDLAGHLYLIGGSLVWSESRAMLQVLRMWLPGSARQCSALCSQARKYAA